MLTDVVKKYIELPCDHFNSGDTTTFRDKYYISYSAVPRAPIFFLMVSPYRSLLKPVAYCHVMLWYGMYDMMWNERAVKVQWMV
jgi:hypothetical protein